MMVAKKQIHTLKAVWNSVKEQEKKLKDIQARVELTRMMIHGARSVLRDDDTHDKADK
ncbi:uncharacterized protein LOC144875029 isoform X3 [Branchiostoma floridae x Branchiostoma japonicum]